MSFSRALNILLAFSSISRDHGRSVNTPRFLSLLKSLCQTNSMIKVPATIFYQIYSYTFNIVTHQFIFQWFKFNLSLLNQGSFLQCNSFLALTLLVCCIKLTVLASSGIDYDIKLWTPSAKEPMEPKDKDEVCIAECSIQYSQIKENSFSQ